MAPAALILLNTSASSPLSRGRLNGTSCCSGSVVGAGADQLSPWSLDWLNQIYPPSGCGRRLPVCRPEADTHMDTTQALRDRHVTPVPQSEEIFTALTCLLPTHFSPGSVRQ